MGVWHDPYWQERDQRWDNDVQRRSLGSGSISTLPVGDETVAARRPFGFGTSNEKTAPVEDWGEADWTARDLRG